MALEEFQRLLLRVYTDRSLQERLHAGTLPGLERLSAREKAALQRIPREPLERFQRALAGKRSANLARRARSSPERVMCSAFSLYGPVLSFDRGEGVRNVHLSRDAVRMAKRLSEAGWPLSFFSLIRAYGENADMPLRALIELGMPLVRYRLGGSLITYL